MDMNKNIKGSLALGESKHRDTSRTPYRPTPVPHSFLIAAARPLSYSLRDDNIEHERGGSLMHECHLGLESAQCAHADVAAAVAAGGSVCPVANVQPQICVWA